MIPRADYLAKRGASQGLELSGSLVRCPPGLHVEAVAIRTYWECPEVRVGARLGPGEKAVPVSLTGRPEYFGYHIGAVADG